MTIGKNIQLIIKKYFIMHEPEVDDTWGPSAALPAVGAVLQYGVRKDEEKAARQLKSEPKTASKWMVSAQISRGAEDDVEYQHHVHTL